MSPPYLPGSYLVVELTNRCSLACVHCSVAEGAAHPHHARTGYIDPALVLGVFDDLARVGARFQTLILFWLGEPLLHPDFGLIYTSAVRAAAEHGIFEQIEVHTNATHLTERRTRIALNDASVRQVWHFSLDAAERDTYARVKGRDRFGQVEDNLAAFIEAKGRTGARWPRPVFQFIVGSNNVDQVGSFRRRWEGACRRADVPVRVAAQHVPPGEDAVVFFRQLDCPTPEIQAAENAVFRRAMADQQLALPREDRSPTVVAARNLAPCSGFWKSPVIGWNGVVTTCTRDNLFHNAVGTLDEAPFSELWWGDTMADRRRRVAQGNYAGLDLCTTCFIPRSSNHTDLSDHDVAAQAAFDARVA